MLRWLLVLVLFFSLACPSFADEYLRVGSKVFPKSYIHNFDKGRVFDVLTLSIKPVIILNSSSYTTDMIFFDSERERDKAFDYIYEEMNKGYD